MICLALLAFEAGWVEILAFKRELLAVFRGVSPSGFETLSTDDPKRD